MHNRLRHRSFILGILLLTLLLLAISPIAASNAEETSSPESLQVAAQDSAATSSSIIAPASQTGALSEAIPASGTETISGTQTTSATTPTPDEAPSSAMAKEQTSVQPVKVRLILAWLAQAQFAGFYVAQDQGYYTDAGLDVEIIPGGTDLRPLPALEGGQADFAVMMLAEGLTGRARGLPLVNVAQLMQTSSLMLVARKDSGIRTPRDLKGKRVSLWFGGLDIAPRALFRRYRVEPTMVPQGQTIELFLRGGVDATSAMWYNEYHTMLASGLDPDELTTLFLRDEGLNFPEDGIYCLAPYLRKNPETARKFVQATLKGWQTAFEQPDKALDLVLERMAQEKRAANVAHQRWMLDRMFDMMVPHHKRSGKTMPTGILAIEDFDRVLWILTEEGYVRSNLKYSDFAKEPNK